MITKNLFIRLLESVKSFSNTVDTLYNNYHIDLAYSPFCDSFYDLVNLIYTMAFTDAGKDLVDWWLFEDVEKYIYFNGEVIDDLTKAEDLYDYMVKDAEIYLK